jgi:hypothetical protein
MGHFGIKMIETYERKSTTADLNEYCHFAKEHDTIEVVEWVNGEGVDVDINTETNRGLVRFNLTFGEWNCLKEIMTRVNA